MQQDSNVQIVKDTYAAFSKGDIPAILNNLDPEAIFTIPGSPAVAMSGVYKGREGVRRLFENLAARHEYHQIRSPRFDRGRRSSGGAGTV